MAVGQVSNSTTILDSSERPGETGESGNESERITPLPDLRKTIGTIYTIDIKRRLFPEDMDSDEPSILLYVKGRAFDLHSPAPFLFKDKEYLLFLQDPESKDKPDVESDGLIYKSLDSMDTSGFYKLHSGRRGLKTLSSENFYLIEKTRLVLRNRKRKCTYP